MVTIPINSKKLFTNLRFNRSSSTSGETCERTRTSIYCFQPLSACLGRCRPLLVHIIVASETEFDDVMIDVCVFLLKKKKKRTQVHRRLMGPMWQMRDRTFHFKACKKFHRQLQISIRLPALWYAGRDRGSRAVKRPDSERQRGNIYTIKHSEYHVALVLVNIWSILGGKRAHVKGCCWKWDSGISES